VTTDWNTILTLLPELILICTATLIYVVGAFLPTFKGWSWVALVGIIAAGLGLRELFPTEPTVSADGARLLYSGPVVLDLLAYNLRGLTLVLGALFVLLSDRSARSVQTPEFVGSLVLIVAGLMFVCGANDLVLLFLGLELISIPTYILLFLSRRDTLAQEATAKYFYLSILSSGLLLYGFSFLYGAAGSTSLTAIRAAVAGGNQGLAVDNLARIALVFVFAGLGFRMAAVPFHFYAPDVYQGANHANAGLLSVIPKVAGLVALVRVAVLALPGLESVGWKVALIVSVLTMTLGNLVALWQTRLRRMLAYSSIAHAGYLLIGLAVAFAGAQEAALGAVPAGRAADGLTASLFYLATYALGTTGAFAALAYLSRQGKPLETIDDLAGIGWAQPWAGLCLAICMFSLTGVPPMAGFWGKLSLFMGPVQLASDPATVSLRPYFVFLAIAGVVNAAVAAAYYLRIVAVSYFRPSPTSTEPSGGPGALAAMSICAVLVLAVGVAPSLIVSRAAASSRDALNAAATVAPPAVAQANSPAAR
jgi:NADH-quinone oxidoreductase subunit N